MSAMTAKDYGASAKVPANNPVLMQVNAMNAPYSLQATGVDKQNKVLPLTSENVDALATNTRVLYGNKEGYVKSVTLDAFFVLVSCVITFLDKEKNEIDTTFTKAELIANSEFFIVQ